MDPTQQDSETVRKLTMEDTILETDLCQALAISQEDWDAMTEQEQARWHETATPTWCPVNPRYVGKSLIEMWRIEPLVDWTQVEIRRP